MAFNAAVWAECRKFAVEFLKEARTRLDLPVLDPWWDKAVDEYETVSSSLSRVQKLYPFDPQLSMDRIGSDGRSREASEALIKAEEAEASGLEALANIVSDLET